MNAKASSGRSGAAPSRPEDAATGLDTGYTEAKQTSPAVGAQPFAYMMTCPQCFA